MEDERSGKMDDPRITMEEAGRGFAIFGDALRNTEGGRRLMSTLFIGMCLRDWECDRSIWRRMSDHVIDYLVDHYWPLYAFFAAWFVATIAALIYLVE